MKVLVVGGTGLIGGETALHLQALGHEVTLMARTKPQEGVLSTLPFLLADYTNPAMDRTHLQGFDWLVFSAAADIRSVPMDGSVSPEDFYQQTNDEAVPRFFSAAAAAGIRRAVYIGTFYPQVAPQKIGVCPYVTSRHNTDERVRALSTDDFTVCSLNAPFVLGHVPGVEVPHIRALVEYVRGNLPDLPLFAPLGGSNHVSTGSIAHAVANALVRGECGKAYLMGDENYSWKEYLELWCEAVRRPVDLPVMEDDHPMLPNVIMFAGAGATVSYEPALEDINVLDYPRQQIEKTIREVVAAYS